MGTIRYCDRCKTDSARLKQLTLSDGCYPHAAVVWQYELCPTCVGCILEIIKRGKEPQAS